MSVKNKAKWPKSGFLEILLSVLGLKQDSILNAANPLTNFEKQEYYQNECQLFWCLFKSHACDLQACCM